MQTLQKLRIRDIYDFDTNPSLIVGSDEDFVNIIQRFASLPELRGIIVADGEQRFLGVMTRTDLLDWARMKLSPLSYVFSPHHEKTFRLISLIHASTAGQVMRSDSHRAAVKPDDSLAHVLRLMIELDLIVLPVVDKANRVVGDLKLSELLAAVIVVD